MRPRSGLAPRRPASKAGDPFLDLGIAAREIRLARGWSQAEVARRMGTRQSKIARIESAQENLTLGTLLRLAQALDATVTLDLEPVFRSPFRRR